MYYINIFNIMIYNSIGKFCYKIVEAENLSDINVIINSNMQKIEPETNQS